MFKVGDRVRRTGFSTSLIKTGKIYTVAGIVGTHFLYLKEIRNGDPCFTYYFSNFEAAPSTVTPQELADQYRKARAETWATGQALEAAGYTLYDVNRRSIRRYTGSKPDVFIERTTTTTETL
jgi:hypothetical protein